MIARTLALAAVAALSIATAAIAAEDDRVFRCDAVAPEYRLCDRFPGRPWLVETGDEDDGTYRLAGYATETAARAALVDDAR